MNDDFDAECDEVLARARRAYSPAPRAAARVSETLQRTILVNGGAREPAVEASSRRARPPATTALVSIGVLVCGLISLRLAAPEPCADDTAIDVPAAPPIAQPVKPTPLAPVPVIDVPQPVHGKAAPERARRKPRAVPVTPAPSEHETLQIEVQALRRVERALRDGHASEALSALDELDRAVPQGKLGEERRAARTIARCTLEPNARSALLRSYSARHTASMYLRRVQASCESAAGRGQ